MKKLKKYRVKLEFRVKDTIEVEAASEDEAEREALSQVQISGANAEHYDTQIDEMD